MNWLHRFRIRLRSVFRRGLVERELRDEIRFHVDMETQKNVTLGMPSHVARREALISFGGAQRFEEEARDARPFAFVDDVLRDGRYAIRSLRNSPLFAVIAILTLATGIGASTSIFSIVNRVLLKPLPYAAADRLTLLWHRAENVGPSRLRVAAPDVQVFKDEADLFQDFAFFNNVADVTMTVAADSEHLRIGSVTGNLFDVLGVTPIVGRTFAPGEGIVPGGAFEEDGFQPSPAPLLLGAELWETRFGSDSGIVGQTISINGNVARVIGVLPHGFEIILPSDIGLATRADAWTPIRQELSQFRRVDRLRDQDSDNTGAVIGRLRNGVTVAMAQAQLDAIAARQRDRIVTYRDAGIRVDVRDMHDDVVSQIRPALRALFGAVVFVLLIACVNVSNLLLARATNRGQEMALRTALGAGRGRLVRQLLVESGLLAVVGGMLGLMMAWVGTKYVVGLAPVALPQGTQIGVEPLVLGFALVVSVLSAFAFGLVPAVRASKTGHTMALRNRSGDTGSQRLWKSLLITELALSLTLLIGAGLMLRSFVRLQTVRPGFDTDGLLTFNMTFPGNSGGPAARARILSSLNSELRSLPGVSDVGFSGGLPLSGVVWTQPYGFEGQPVDRWGQNEANFRVITSGYLPALGTRLLSGRFFTEEEDVLEFERVVIVDIQLARRIDPSGNVVGRTLGVPFEGAPTTATIVGVVESVYHESLRQVGRETIYVPYRQEASRTIGVAVRSVSDPATLIDPIRSRLEALSFGTPIVGYEYRTMSEYVQTALASTRFTLLLIAAFSLIAVVLTSVGVYGVISYSVSRRVHEIGIRMALGAGNQRVLAGILMSGIRVLVAGVVLGWLLSLVTSRVLATLVYGVQTTDVLTYLSVGLLLGLVTLTACYVPALRATRITPLAALRTD